MLNTIVELCDYLWGKFFLQRQKTNKQKTCEKGLTISTIVNIVVCFFQVNIKWQVIQ